MKTGRFLLTAIICLLPASASAQSLAISDWTPGQDYKRPNLSFALVEPDHRFLPEGYRPQDTGYEVRGILESALSRTLDGIIEYRWNEGGNPTLNVAGVPAAMKVRRSAVILGVNYDF